METFEVKELGEAVERIPTPTMEPTEEHESDLEYLFDQRAVEIDPGGWEPTRSARKVGCGSQASISQNRGFRAAINCRNGATTAARVAANPPGLAGGRPPATNEHT